MRGSLLGTIVLYAGQVAVVIAEDLEAFTVTVRRLVDLAILHPVKVGELEPAEFVGQLLETLNSDLANLKDRIQVLERVGAETARRVDAAPATTP
jgi:hypothetical protein